MKPFGMNDKEFRDMWFRPDHKNLQALEQEAEREILPGHELRGFRLTAIARCTGCHNAVFQVSDGTFAIVNLTWTAKPDPPWPQTIRLGSFLAVEMVMDQHEH